MGVTWGRKRTKITCSRANNPLFRRPVDRNERKMINLRVFERAKIIAYRPRPLVLYLRERRSHRSKGLPGGGGGDGGDGGSGHGKICRAPACRGHRVESCDGHFPDGGEFGILYLCFCFPPNQFPADDERTRPRVTGSNATDEGPPGFGPGGNVEAVKRTS